MELEHHIEMLIDQGASDFEISKLIKQHIKTYLSSLDSLFEQTQGKDFLVKHTKSIDGFVKVIFKYTLRQYFGNYMPLYNALPITLVAMGSYGREELCVYSDIDLMIVYKDIKGYNIEPIITAMLYLAWDAGMKLGHRTHKVEELLDASGEDLTIKTAMLESRFLCGSKFLWMETERELFRIRRHDMRAYIEEKITTYRARGEQYPLTMEPNIKQGVGGLRDANTLYWVAQCLHGVTKLKDLVPRFLSEEEFRDLRMAQEFLFRLRSALHLSANKKQDTLNLELIPSVAQKLGFVDKRLQSAQMSLAKKTFESLWTLKITSQIYIKRLCAPLFCDLSNLSSLRAARFRKKLYMVEGTLYASFHKKPDTLKTILEMFLSLEDVPLGFDISFIHYLRQTPLKVHNSPAIYALFKRLFHRQHLNQFLYAFYKAGLLQDLIKPMRHAINLPQFDGYHIYPVDIHSLKCVWHLEHIQDPFIQALLDDLCGDGKALLRLVVLFHDIGKGRKGDHSEIGARLFKLYAQKLGFKEESIAMGVLLIRYHTYMSNVANREDIYNEKVILSFVSTLGDPKALCLLYILTYCDINGVSPTTYSTFTAKLLRELYDLALEAFPKDALVDEASRRRKKEKALAKNPSFMALSNATQRKILGIPSTFFFLKHKTHEIVSISSWALEIKDYDAHILNHQHLSISLVRTRPFNLGYFLSKVAYLDLAHMEIFKLFDGKKYFKIEFNEVAEDIGHISQLIDESFDMSKRTTLKQPIILEDELAFDCEHSSTYAQLSLKAKDQQGLMAYIISVFDEWGLDISSAKIQTIKHRARNLFLIEKQGKLCDNKEKIIALLCGKKEG
ncbi:MAG: HD domain-containing protein [Campylobacterales bacterium]|nr:HD domain-containing protein [Campylobacterales bacterium]